MPKISVVIPLYNKENFIKQTLKSVLNQSLTDFEVLIINDKSTDKSLEIVSNFTDNRIKIINHEVNKGLSASRNTGIKNAISNYIAFLDADDYWNVNFLSTIFSLIIEFPEAKGFATNYFEDRNGKLKIPNNNTQLFSDDYKGLLDFFKLNLKQVVYLPSSLCIHKSVFKSIGMYNEEITYCEDVDFNLRFHTHFKLAYSNKKMCYYRVFSENQIMHSSISNKILPNYLFYEKKYKENKSLKKYLDFERFLICKKLKLEKNNLLFNVYLQEINLKNLNWKQRLILQIPLVFLLILIKIKIIFTHYGLQVNSYSYFLKKH